MDIRSVRARAMTFFVSMRTKVVVLWAGYRARPLWQQALLGLIALAVLWGLFSFFTKSPTVESANKPRAVALASVGELNGGSVGGNFIGTVRSITEANILAQSGGTVRAVHASLGRYIPAGFIIAELDNASERAAVLQAEGSYEAALAARTVAQQQAQNTNQSLTEAAVSARNTYRSSYTTLDVALNTYVDTFFGSATSFGPKLLINPDLGPYYTLPKARRDITDQMRDWKNALSTAQTRDPETLLAEAEVVARSISDLLVKLGSAANRRDSGASATQLSALATAQTTVDAQLTALSTARSSYRAAATAAAVGKTQTESGTATASADAAVKQALGALRGAQANFEKTVVRAPLAGTINFLPLRVGDYVTSFTHVATVAQNGALEVVTYVSQADRDLLSVGAKVTLDGAPGTVTSIAPALDPVRKQIEVRIAAAAGSTLVNGQSVQVRLASAAPSPTTSKGPTTLPLSAVKLLTDKRIVFVVEDGRLVAQEVEVGEVRGGRIEIASPLAADLRIVVDARGLVDGEKVVTLP